MKERHDNEQYFFDQGTINAMADLLERFQCPCVLCAPSVGVALEERGVAVTTLDIDERFAHLRGFRTWDIARPVPINTRFDVIFCDPPFFSFSLSQLFQAIRMLAQFDLTQRLAITYLVRRKDALLKTFAPFGISETDIRPGYETVQPIEKNDIVLFANFDTENTQS